MSHSGFRVLRTSVTICLIIAMLATPLRGLVPQAHAQDGTPPPPVATHPPESPTSTPPAAAPTATASVTPTAPETTIPTDTPTGLPSATTIPTDTPLPTAPPTDTVLPPTAPATLVPPVSAPAWLLADGAEVDAGLWSMTGGWTRSETDAAHEGLWLWATGPQGSVDHALLQLVQPVGLPAEARITLTYWQRTPVHNPDSLHVQVERANGLWQPVGQGAASGSADWTLRTVDLSAFAGQSVRLRFAIAPDSDPDTPGAVWQLDDIGLLAEPALWIPTPVPTTPPALNPTIPASETVPVMPPAPTVTETPETTLARDWLTVQDTDARLLYAGGAWQRFQVAGAAGGTLTGTAGAGATLTVRFSGTGIRFIYSKGPEGQPFTAQVDGAAQTGDGQTAQYSYGHALTFADLPDGDHVLTVTNGDGALWIEAIQVQGAVLDPPVAEPSEQPPAQAMIPPENAWTTYADSGAAVGYGCGHWQTFPVREAAGGSLTGSADPGSTMTVTFEGTGIAVIHAAGPEGRTFRVELDGSATQVADGYAAQYTYGRQVRFAGLPDGEHVLTVTNGDGALWIEAIQVQGRIKSTAGSPPRCPQPTATPGALPGYTPPSACWVRHWNGQGSTEWAISNPNPVPLSTNPEVKLRYDWAAYKKPNASGKRLQSAQGWDNPNPNPVNTVYAQSLKLSWYLTIDGQDTAILGTQIVNADETGSCTPPEPTATLTATPTNTPEVTLDPEACLLTGVDNTGQSASQFFWLETATGLSAGLEPRYDGLDIEGIDVHPVTGVLYAVGGHRVQDDGPVYRLDAAGALTLLGTTGYRDQVAASFRPGDGSFWMFVAHVGLITVDLGDVSQTTVQYATRKKVEAIAWNEDGSLLYALVGRNLYAYDPATGDFSRTCKNLLPGDVIPALEWGPDGLVSGVHHGTETRFVRIDPAACTVTAPLYSAPYHHVKSLTYNLACTAPTPTPTFTPTFTDTPTPTDTPTATPTFTPTFTPTDTPTATPTDTPTHTPTNTPTDTPTNTPTFTPTHTPTNTPTPTLPAGVMCYDWRWGDAFGWIDSSPDRVTWDENGMYAASDPGDPITASAYYALDAGGPWSLALTGNDAGAFTVAQGATAPAPGELLEQTVSPDAAGTYVLTEPFVQLQWAADGLFDPATTTAFHTFCLGEVPPGANRPPQVDAGPDLEWFMTGPDPIVMTLDGTATDDGLPSGTLDLLWELTDGPDSLVWDDAALEDPTVTLTEPGVYLLRLTADDGELSAGDTLQIAVHPAPDLTVTAVDASELTMGGYTREITGDVSADITNLGPGPVVEPYTLTFFDDVDGDGLYTEGIDSALASVEADPLGVGDSLTLTVAVSGVVAESSTQIYAHIDSADVIYESDETNNVNSDAWPEPIPVAYRTYTLDADFDEGAYQHVDHAEQPDELRLQGHPDRFEYIWVAVSGKGTVAKIDINNGDVLGEYWTSPSGQPKDPSRTTVDNYGSVWVANRAGNSVTKIGLLENGECEDRNGDGVIQTSTGLNDLLLWPNTGGADTNGGVSTAEDECILHYVRVSANGTRHVSVDQDNNVWVSGRTGDGDSTRPFDLIDGETGQIIRQEPSVGYGGYGGLIDGNGVIWSARRLMRWDTSLPLTSGNWQGYSHDSYGLCIDSQGNVWNTSYTGNQIRKFAPDGTLLATYAHGHNNARGCVVDYNDHVWIAQSDGDSVAHLLPDGTLVGRISVGDMPTGTAVDVNGKIWVTNHNSRTVMRIDPDAGPVGGGGVPVGAVDLTTANLGGTLYNYSDMTGSTLTKLPDEGHWEVVFDSGIEGAAWGVLGWTENRCNDGLLEVFAASSTNGTTFSALAGIENGGEIAVPDGRYLRITANFRRATTGETPVLYDLTVGTAGYVLPDLPPAPPMTCIDTLPDLTVSNLQQTVNGSDLALAARVNNLGGIAAAPGAVVTFYSGDPAQPGTVALGTAATTGEILPGAYETVSLTLPLGTTARPVWLVVDEANAIEELNERNNTYASTIYLSPDLMVNGVDRSGMAFDIDTLETYGEIRVDIGNVGTAEAFGGYTVRLFEDRDGSGTYDETVDLLLGSALQFALLPGETTSVTFPLAEGTLLSFRDSILAVVVDSDHLQVELDEMNNAWTTADPALPDLTASYMREEEFEDRTELTVRVGNGGGVAAPAGAEVAFYDGDPNDGGALLDTVLTTVDLAPGGYEDVLLSLPLGTTALPVWVWVDPADAYAEPDEANNLYETRAWVTPVPNEAPVVDAGPDRVLPLPDGTIALHATASDDGWPVGELRHSWRVVSGPGEVTFDDEASLTPQVSASEAGEYVLELTADDREYRASDTMMLTAMTAPLCDPATVQGFIAAPLNEAHVTGQAPVTLAAEADLTHLRVDLWPAFDPDAFRPLAENVTGAGGATVATLDATLLANDSYVICAVGFDTVAEDWQSAAVMVTVEGEHKPGRVRFSVTDLVVPVTGLPITIGRTYDSLERDYRGDFGYGWKLDIANPRVEVDAANNVTLTMPDGSRKTFYFTPHTPSWVFGFLSLPQYTPEPGVYGSLESDGCDLLTVSGGQTFCFPGPLYAETVTEFTYTDPYGRAFVMSADGVLKSIRDLNDNTLTFSPDGITSSSGLSVPFVRDSQGRIVRITDPMGHIYRYEYDAAGDLVAVYLPDTPAISYDYYDTPALAHFFRSGTDPRGNPVATTTYYPDGRLETVTDALGSVTAYAYDLDAHTTTITNPDGGVEVSAFDAAGNLLSQTNPLGHTTTYTYDANNNLLSETNALGETTTYTYNENGHRTSVTNPLGITTTAVDYNSYGGPTTITNALGHITTIEYAPITSMPLSAGDSLGTLGGYTWDSHGNPLTYRDGNDELTSYTYDAYGNVLTETNPLGGTTSFTYDLLGRGLTATNALGHTTTYTYDALGHLLSETDEIGNTTSYEYDYNHNLTTEIDPMGRRTTYEYDAANNPTLTVFPDGTTIERTYDFRGNPLTETNGLGHTTRYHYDLIGKLIQVITAEGTPDQAVTQYGYDTAGRRTQVTDPLGHTSNYIYDADGRLVEVRDPLGHAVTYAYDVMGRPISQTDANGHRRTFDYDTRQRLVAITYPDGTTEQYTYDGVGQLVMLTDQAGKVTSYTYDAVSHLLSVTDPLGHSTQYTYDLLGSLTSITDANNHQTAFDYDALGRLTQKTWPDGLLEAFSYDAVGNRTGHQLADGQVNTFVYDSLDRLTKAQYFDGQSVTYTYTPTSRRQTVTDGRGTTTYVFDSQDRITRIIQPDGREVSYSYDAAGNRLSLTTPAGTVTYGYDTANRLTSVTGLQGATTTYAYDAFGLLLQMQYPNGITVDYGYDALNRLTDITQHRAGSVISSYTYTLGSVGNRLSVVEDDGSSIQWAYDDAHQLLEETRYDPTGALITQTAFTYDPVGNCLTETVDGQTTLFTYNVLDQLLSAGSAQYTYDGRGNVSRLQNGPDITTYTWDAQDRLTGAMLPDGTTAVYSYDADGRRVGQIVAGQTTHYLWDELSPYSDVVLETDAAGTPLASYVLGNTQLISQTRSGVTSFYLHDGQGSVRALANIAGSITDTYAYTAFGELYTQIGTTVNSYLYTGQQFDAVTELYSLRNRYYSPSVGRFYSQDTFPPDLGNPVGLNRYAYVSNNPVNLIDPSGLFAVEYQTILSKVSITAILVGAGIGTGSDVAFQLVFSDGTLEERWNSLNWKSVLVSGFLGAISGGFGSYAAVAGKSAYIYAIGNLFIDIGLGTLMDIVFLDQDPLQALATNAISFGLATAVGFVIGKIIRAISVRVGPYAHLVDPPHVAAGRDFTRAQRRNILEENMRRNGGVLRSDLSGEILVIPQQHQPGVTPPWNEAHIDHIIPKSRGGTNSYSNAQVLSRAENLSKGNTMP